MAKRHENIKNKVLLILGGLLILFLGLYFIFRGQYDWVPNIMSELIGVAWVGFIIVYAVKQTTKLKDFLLLYVFILASAIMAFVYGQRFGIEFLTDVMPEFIGGTGLAIILSLIFKKKMML